MSVLADHATTRIGAVVIGRNEGERLLRGLRTLRSQLQNIVYVDSGSTDGSAGRARGLGIEVIELKPDAPFTAARARNAGIRRLLQLDPNLRYVQVVDADCELMPGWLEIAARRLDRNPSLAVVVVRRVDRLIMTALTVYR